MDKTDKLDGDLFRLSLSVFHKNNRRISDHDNYGANLVYSHLGGYELQVGELLVLD
jgi:hypothetical protein